MNTQEYISSGIIESCVLGLADAADIAEFERMCAAHAEVREARDAFEVSLEEYARLNAIQPRKNLKSQIFAQIDIEEDQAGRGSGAQVASMYGENPATETASPRVAGSGFMRYLAAAAVIALVISSALNFYFFNRYKEYNALYEDLVNNQRLMVSNNEILQAKVQEYEQAFKSIRDPNMAIVKMPAVPTAPDPASATTIYWDTVSKDVYLVVNQLPAPSAEQQYQLWALVDGVPVDAGVFDVKDGAGLQKMKNIPRAQAFAITLEKKGGSPSPTMEKMFVMGKV